VTDCLEDDLGTALRCLDRADYREVVAVDLSLPEYGIPVARVIVPGLRVADD
jgi:ribosomal protein S12 methylthiotransferase accessory factor